MNPFNNINPANPMNSNRIGQMKNMMDMFRNSKNPMMLFQQMDQKNPQFQPVLQMMKQGMNPNQIFEITRIKFLNEKLNELVKNV